MFFLSVQVYVHNFFYVVIAIFSKNLTHSNHSKKHKICTMKWIAPVQLTFYEKNLNNFNGFRLSFGQQCALHFFLVDLLCAFSLMLIWDEEECCFHLVFWSCFNHIVPV